MTMIHKFSCASGQWYLRRRSITIRPVVTIMFPFFPFFSYSLVLVFVSSRPVSQRPFFPSFSSRLSLLFSSRISLLFVYVGRTDYSEEKGKRTIEIGNRKESVRITNREKVYVIRTWVLTPSAHPAFAFFYFLFFILLSACPRVYRTPSGGAGNLGSLRVAAPELRSGRCFFIRR